MINYDLHWNPVRLMQRIGRVDRRLSPEVEARLVGDHPEQAKLRGQVAYWNFLPPDELNELLTLYRRVTHRKTDDALHVAIATVAGLEIVVSWNHRHLANPRKWTLFNAVNRLAGYEQPLMILTPFLVMR
jgi:hypothetical protein